MNELLNRRGRRAAAATGTAPVEPAIEAATARAASERDPASTSDIPAVTAPVLPVEALPVDSTAVLPEPTLTAEPDRPMPIVTASPILAVEPGAVDVAQAEATAERVATGAEEPGDRDRLHDAAAGQPTLTINDGAAATAAAIKAAIDDGVVGGFDRVTTPGYDRRVRGADESLDEDTVVSLDQLIADLELLAQYDPGGMDVIRRRFFRAPDFQSLPAGPTVTVIEVVGPAGGRRRAGMSFGSVARRFLASDLRADELDALRTDPLLAVGVTEMAEDEALALLGPVAPSVSV